MKLYVIEDLTTDDLKAISQRLQAMELEAGLDGLYWLPVPEQYLSEIQQNHNDKCGPFAMALELLDDSLKMELLVRARNMLRCDCIAYAPPALQTHMMGYMDSLLAELGIQV